MFVEMALRDKLHENLHSVTVPGGMRGLISYVHVVLRRWRVKRTQKGFIKQVGSVIYI